MRHPYISVTDFQNVEQVRSMLGILKRLSSRHHLGVGVMTSYKVMHGLPSKWAGVFPDPARLSEIFQPIPDVINALHYADYDDLTGVQDLRHAIEVAGVHLDAVQLDMVWPDPSMLADARGAKSLFSEYILQINSRAMKECGDEPYLVAQKLEKYAEYGVLDYVLLDRSMGQGQGMDAHLLLRYAREIRKKFPHVGIVVAGGLGPGTVRLAEPIIREIPEVSLDAQGRLRSSGSALDPIEWDRAARYLEQAVRLYRECDRSVSVQ